MHLPLDGSATDVTGNGHSGTVYGATPVQDRFGTAAAAYNFDGVDDYIQIPYSSDFTFDFGEQFTVSAWVKFCISQPWYTGASPEGVYIIGQGKFLSRRSNQGFALVVGLLNAAASDGTQTLGTTTVGDGEWHLLTAVWFRKFPDLPDIRDSVALFIDAAWERSTTFAVNMEDDEHSTQDLFIGLNGGRNKYYTGAVDDVRIYDRALTPAEISTLYRANGWPITPPKVQLTLQPLGPLAFCKGDSVRLQASGNADWYLWTPATGLSNSRSPNPTAAPGETTTYTVTGYKIHGDEPCIDTLKSTPEKVTVTVHQPPLINAGGTRYACPGAVVRIGGDASLGTPPYRYAWSPTTGLDNPSIAQPLARPTAPIRYTVLVTDANGCTAVDSMQIQMFTAAKIAVGPDLSICRGSGVELNAEPTNVADGPYKYAWSPRTGLNDSTVGKPIANPTTRTEYIVTVTTSTGCVSRDTIVVSLKEMPVADAGTDITICRDSAVTLGRSTGTHYRYQWSPADGLSDPATATPTARPQATTTYRLTATDTNGCSMTDEVTITVLDPRMTASTKMLAFGSLEGCVGSKELEVTLTNDGNADMMIEGADSDNPAFSVITTLPRELKQGKATTLRIRFAPRGAGTATGRMVIAGSVCGASVVIDMAGEKQQSFVAADLGGVSFGSAPACEKVEHDTIIVLRNNGTSQADIGTGTVPAPFIVIPSQLPRRLAPGDTLALRVRYAPAGAGAYTADLMLPYVNGECSDTIRITLSGIHASPTATADPQAIDFGPLSGCMTNRDTIITIRNPGILDIDLTSAQLPAGYKVMSGIPASIPAGESRSVALRYEPAGSGSFNGPLSFAYEPCGGRLDLDLRGTKQGISVTTPDSLAFGVLVACRETELSRPVVLSYEGGEGSIGMMEINGPFATTMSAGAALPDGQPRTFDVTFTPTADGTVTGWIALRLEPCGIERRIILTGSRTNVGLTADPVSFGTQSLGSVSTRDLYFVNTGTAVVRVEGLNGVVPPFAVESTSPGLPADMSPGDTLRVRVRYTATSGTQWIVVRADMTEPCILEATTEVDGSGGAEAVAEIGLPVVTAAAGDKVLVPIELSGSRNLPGSGATRWSATLRFNKTLLLPSGATPNGTIDGEERVVTIEGELKPDQTRGDLGQVELTAMLGNVESTPLRVESFSFDKAVAVTARDGEFRLENLCRYGTIRLVESEGKLTLKPNRPNPVTWMTEIEYELIEGGITELYIADATGRRVVTLVEGDARRGRYIVQFDVGELASGTYMYILETPTQRLSRTMQIAK